jgi:hypothetical protein
VVAARELVSDLAVESEIGLLLEGAEVEFELHAIGKNERAIGEHVRADGRQHKGLQHRIENWSASGERIGGGTGGRGNDEAISTIASEKMPIHGEIEIKHARERGLGDNGVVERLLALDDLTVANQFGLEHHARADAVFSGEDLFEQGNCLVKSYAGHEAHAAEIDGEDGHFALDELARGGEKRAVAAENDEHVHFGGHFLRAGFFFGRIEAGGPCGVEENFNAAFAQPLHDARNDGADFLFVRLAADASGFNHCRIIAVQLGLSECGELYRIAALGVEKIFLIAFGAGDAARLHSEDGEAAFFGGGAQAGNGALVQLRIADDAAFADELFFEFELGLDENEKCGVGRSDGGERGKNFCDGDERNVDGDDSWRFGQVFQFQESRIFLDLAHALVALEFPVELRGVHVDGEDAARAVLEQAIGEATVGRADIEADAAGDIDGKIGESAFEFEPATAGVF